MINRTQLRERLKEMRFLEARDRWQEGRITQEEAALMLNVCARTFRRYLHQYEEEGLCGLQDKRLHQSSHRKASVDEVFALTERYQKAYLGWNARHYHERYQAEGGSRSYTFVKNVLQASGLMKKSDKKGKHRKRRERKPLPGMLIHQDGSTHEWVPGKKWDLIATLDDATNEHYSLFFTDQEGTQSSLMGIADVIQKRGLFCAFYSDRGSHYWHTPEAGGKVDKQHRTQFGAALSRLGIEQIAAYSPEARGRSERMFKTHQDRLVKELALHSITDMAHANRYLKTTYLRAFNQRFMKRAAEEGSAFVPYVGNLKDILCERHERTVGNDNCVSFENLKLQIPADTHRCHYVKAKVIVTRRIDQSLAIYHGPRKLAEYDPKGRPQERRKKKAA